MRTGDEGAATGVGTPAPGQQPALDGPGWSPTRAAVVLGVLWGLAAMGTSATSVVIGPLSDDLGLGTSGSAWVLTAFALTFAASTAVFGRIADSVGARTPFVVGALLLAVGASVSAAAPDFVVLLLGRLLQGVGAGAIPVLTSTILSARYSGRDRAVALGRSNSVVLVITSIGPLAGGALGVLVGWRGPFLLPVLVLALLPFAARLAPARGTGGRFDAVGAGLVALTAALLLALVQTVGAPGPVTWVAGVLLLPALLVVALWVRRHPDGFVPAQVLRDDTVVRAGIAAAGMPVVYFAGLVAVPLQLAARGWDPFENGLLLLPGALVGATVSFNSARVLARLGRRGTAMLGLSLSSVGALVSAGVVFSPWLAGIGFVGLTVGYALAQPSLVGAVAAAVPGDLRGAALGLFTLVFFIGAGLGSAVVGGLGDLLGLSGALAVAVIGPTTGVLVLATARRSPAWGGRAGDA
jgi:MFS family permease